MADPDNNPQVTDALNLHDDVDEALEKAKAIIWLMSHQDTSECFNEDALRWAGMVARDLIDTSMSAVEDNFEKAKASV